MKPLQERLQADKHDEYYDWVTTSDLYTNPQSFEIIRDGHAVRGTGDGQDGILIYEHKDSEYRLSFKNGYVCKIEKIGFTKRAIDLRREQANNYSE